ncbi:Ubiquinone biosynthesis monooxygenase COQ6, mitochondrial [Vitis vinifera]|uniref:Ubiquinone biosynthesis monooxygenase COQ6, mitochondrial n=1 Tax=Vitis vinifera TaxID=29760 RepID=A0A438GJH3_VITVI|nr:Ubiquinone biosynthesis monooxygenase COQ6, mitochondrial [Vitis vinifera]
MTLHRNHLPTMMDSTSSSLHGSIAKSELGDGNNLQAKLVELRELTGFKTTGWNYSQNSVICTVEHKIENQCAGPWFLPSGPIALFPVGDKFSNIVWTMNPKESSTCREMNENDFVKALNHALNYGYGPHPQLITTHKESNASNGVQIEAETKKLWPLEDNCTKLKDNFATCEMDNFNLRNFRNLHLNL